MSGFYIDDSNFHRFDTHHNEGELCGKGFLPRIVPYGQSEFCAPCDIPTLPDQEILDAIADQERHQSSAWHVWKDSPIGVLDQDGLSFCHGFSCCDAIMVERERQGLPYVELSASSIAAPVTGYRNAGAYILNDLQQTVKVGVASTEFVPMQTTSRSSFKDGWEQNAEKHRTVEWRDGRPRDSRACASASVRGHAIGIGLNYWGHAVTILRYRIVRADQGAVVLCGKGIAPTILNSWRKTWGDNGCADLYGNKGVPDEWYVLMQIHASKN